MFHLLSSSWLNWWSPVRSFGSLVSVPALNQSPQIWAAGTKNQELHLSQTHQRPVLICVWDRGLFGPSCVQLLFEVALQFHIIMLPPPCLTVQSLTWTPPNVLPVFVSFVSFSPGDVCLVLVDRCWFHSSLKVWGLSACGDGLTGGHGLWGSSRFQLRAGLMFLGLSLNV